MPAHPPRPTLRSKPPAPAAREEQKTARQAQAAKAAPIGAQPASARPGTATPRGVLALQRRYGNRAVKSLVQPKLEVGAAQDGYEREADRVAEQVMRGPVAATPPGDGGAVQRQALPGGGLLRASTLATHSASGLLQRRSALVSAKTTTRQFKGPRTDNLDKDVAAVDKAPKGQGYSRLESIDVHDGKQAHIIDKTGAIAWFRIKSGKGAGEFIKGSKVIGGLAPGQTPPEEQVGSGQEMSGVDLGGQMVGGVDSALIDVYRGATMEQPGDRTKSLEDLTNSPQGQQNIEYAEGATWIGAGILGMAASVRDLMDKDKSAFDKLLASVGLISGAASVAGGVSQIVQYANFDKGIAAQGGSQTSETYNQAAKSGGFLVGFGDMFNSITTGLKTIKNVVDLVKLVAQEKTYDTGQGVKLGTDIISNGLQTANSVVRTVRGFNEVISHGQTATSQFGSVLPGLDIAIAAMGIIQNGYYLGVSALEVLRMRRRKLELEDKLQADHNLTPEQIKAAGKRYRTEEAQEATTDQLIAQATAAYNKLSVKKFSAKSSAERAKLQEKQNGLKAELDQLKQQKTQQEARKGAGAFGEHAGETAEVLRERELASNTHVANKRRVTRQGVHIGTKLLQIGAAIATFVSGPGAPAAMALKLSALGIDSSLPFWRWLKEKGRDQAAKNRAKGEDGWTNKVFNADKSAAAKSRSRHKDAVLILQMVGNLSRLLPAPADPDAVRTQKLQQVRPQAKRVEGYIRAVGCPPQKLYAANGKPAEQVKILVTELSRREL